MEGMKIIDPAATQTQIQLINSLLNTRKSPLNFNTAGIDQTQQINGLTHSSYVLDRYATKNQASLNATQEIVFEITPNSNEILKLNTLCLVITGSLAGGTDVAPSTTPRYLGYKTFARETVEINGAVVYDSPRDTMYFAMLQRTLQPANNGSAKRIYQEQEIQNVVADPKKIQYFAMPTCCMFDNPFGNGILLPRERLKITLQFNPAILNNLTISSVDCVMTGQNVFDTTMVAIEQKSLSPAHILQLENYTVAKTNFTRGQTNINVHISTTKNQHPNYLLFYHTGTAANTYYTISNTQIKNFSVVQNGKTFPNKNLDLENGIGSIFQLKRLVDTFAPGVGFDEEFLNNALPFFVKLGETDNIADKEVADGGPVELSISLSGAEDGLLWVFMMYKGDVVIESPARNTYIAANNNI